jgi:Cupin superfamily protein
VYELIFGEEFCTREADSIGSVSLRGFLTIEWRSPGSSRRVTEDRASPARWCKIRYMDSLIDIMHIVDRDSEAQPRLLRSFGNASPFREITLDRIDRALSSGAVSASQISLARNGEAVARKHYGRIFRYPGLELPEALDYEFVMKSIGEGYTLILHSCEQWLPDLGASVANLRHRAGHPVLAVMFITPASTRGLEIHADAFDNFVFQLAGTKAWEVFDRPAGWIKKDFMTREQAGDASLCATLEAWDVLYIPRGCPHVARADSFSMHLTIGIHTLTIREFLTALMGHPSLLPPELDRTIPFATLGEVPLEALLQPALDALVSQLRKQPWRDMLSDLVGPTPPVRGPGALERLAGGEDGQPLR